MKYLMFVMLLVEVDSARAEAPIVLCADSVAGIEFALSVAEGNGLDNDVRIVAGHYALTQGLSFVSSELGALEISGGWNADCSSQNSSATTLDGQGMDQVLRYVRYETSTLAVSRLTFVNGNTLINHPDSGKASALSIRSSGDVLVEANVFLANQSPDQGGALGVEVFGTATMRVRNNLIAGNSTGYNGGGGSLYGQSGEQYFVGNTVVDNQATQPSSAIIGGILVQNGSSSHFTLSNNVLWGNDGYDIFNVGGSTTNIHNDIESLGGSPIDPVSNGNIHLAPTFAGGILNFHLSPHSPLVNEGVNSPPGGAGSIDLGKAPRLQGSHIDLGAYETDVLFIDGFDLLM